MFSALNTNQTEIKKHHTVDQDEIDQALFKRLTVPEVLTVGVTFKRPVLKMKAEYLAKLLDMNEEFVCCRMVG